MLPDKRNALAADLPDGLKPRLRLFLSVDMVGSTALKQSHEAWRPSVLNFYRDFDHAVYTAYRGFNDRSAHALPTPEFWKSNGDELLYTCELSNHDQAHDTVQVWLHALAKYRASMSVQPGQLDIKSTGWIGLFPLPNAEVFFRRGARDFTADGGDAQLAQAELRDDWYAGRNRQDIIRDFVGPSIDTGFRLTAWATSRRFIISVDLAFLLTSSAGSAEEPLPLHFSGRHVLKGVIDNAPYPEIWIPVGGREIPADPAIGRHVVDGKVLRGYCETIIEQHHHFITPLFLSDANADEHDWAPPYILKAIGKHWAEEQRRTARQAERRAAEAAAPAHESRRRVA